MALLLGLCQVKQQPVGAGQDAQKPVWSYLSYSFSCSRGMWSGRSIHREKDEEQSEGSHWGKNHAWSFEELALKGELPNEEKECDIASGS